LARLGGAAAEAEGTRTLDRRCSTHETATNLLPTLAGLAEGRRGEAQLNQHLRWLWLEPRLPIRPLPRPARKTANRELAARGAPAPIPSSPSKGQGATAAPAAAPAALDSLSRLQQLADASPRVAQLGRLQALADAHYAPVSQLAGAPEEEELLQGQFASAELQPQLQQAPRANNTGLPDHLKSGVESLSGLSMDDVRVHYNASQPAQLNALAYAQGSDIHLAPGQERHLPHEAWHVVQQAQGGVRPTLQLKDGVPVNDDVGRTGQPTPRCVYLWLEGD